jgi:hypothetical protein
MEVVVLKLNEACNMENNSRCCRRAVSKNQLSIKNGLKVLSNNRSIRWMKDNILLVWWLRIIVYDIKLGGTISG